MEPMIGMISGGIHSPVAIAGVKEPREVQRPEEEAEERPQKSVRDEYISEEKQDPTGRYWLRKDENNKPKIYFDDPKREADGPEESKKADAPEKKVSEEKGKTCTANTDKVDREIEKLKKKKAELEQQLNSEKDERKIGELEKELAQVERELRQKDNDTYRRQHTQFTYS